MARRRLVRPRAAFTLIELLVVIAIIALLVSILLPALVGARRTARQAQNLSNQKQLITAVNSYGADFKDRIATFSWKKGQYYEMTVGLNPGGGYRTERWIFGSDLLAAAGQALNIIRRRSQPECTELPTQNNWIPQPTYNHLVLMDFLASRLPDPMLLSPEDRFRQRLSDGVRASGNALAYCLSLNAPQYGGMRITWPYSSSYQFTPACYMPNRESGDNGFLRQYDNQITYLFQQGTSNRYNLGGRKLSEVGFPAQKVCIMEDVGRHVGRNEMPWLHPGAVCTVATFDGTVRTLRTSETNPGGYTRLNGRKLPAIMFYEPRTSWGYPVWPDSTDPRELDLDGRYRWTHEGLRGIDFGGAEPNNLPTP